MIGRAWRAARQALGDGREGGLLASGVGFIAARYLVAASVGAETLLLAAVLGPTTYGRYALIAQTASLLIFVGLGTTPGYVIAFYDDQDADLTDTFLAGSLVQWAVGGILAGIALYLYQPFLALSVLLFFIYVPYFVTEPIMRVRNRFTVAALPKGAASLATVVFAGVVLILLKLAGSGSLTLRQAIVLMFVGNLAVYGAYYRHLARIDGVTHRVRGLLHRWSDRDSWSATGPTSWWPGSRRTSRRWRSRSSITWTASSSRSTARAPSWGSTPWPGSFPRGRC